MAREVGDMTTPLRPPPLAVVTGAARALSIDAPEADRLRALCDQLRSALPAEEVRVVLGQRRGDRLAAGHAPEGTPTCIVDVTWPAGRHATLEAIGSERPVTECRPILETVAALVVAATPTHSPPSTDAELERRLHWLTVDSLPVGLYVVDRTYRIVIWNRKRETGTQGLRRAEVLGRQVFEVLHRQSEAQLRADFARVFDAGEVLEDEQVVSGAEGEARVYRTTRLPMRLDGGEITHVITIGEDVTETRAIQRAMHQTEKLAAVGQLAAGVMHEINNPLATIGACVPVISARLGASPDPKAREYLAIIESEVGRATNIVDGLLDFSRAERAGGGMEPSDLNALLERTLYLLQHHQRFRRLEVVRDLDPALPQVTGNGERLIQAAMAILLNAADATGGQGTVTVTTRREGQWVIAELTDDGPGIPPEVLPNIFEPFYTTKGPSRGTGLGLAICYGIIADHQGRLDVRSEPGRTTFRIALPPARREEAA
jgi:two-component system NtrC family sensor kinase